MLEPNDKPLDFDLEVYDEEGILVDEISCDHIAKACAVAIELVKLHKSFVVVKQKKEFIWKYEYQEAISLKVVRYDKENKRSFILTPPFKVNFKCTAPLKNNGYNDFGCMSVKAVDAPEIVEHFIGNDDYYVEFPVVGRWLVYIKKWASKSEYGFTLNF